MGIANALMEAPSGWTGTATALSGNNYTPDAYGFIIVVSQDVRDLEGMGFAVVSWAGKRNNLTATADPVAANDNTQDFAPGSVWYNIGTITTGPRLWECVSANTGAAVWALKSQEPANFRNLLDGGDFTTNPFQRNIAGLASGGTLTADVSSTVTYFADRWFGVGGASSAIKMSAVADTSIQGFGQCLKFQRKAANANTAAIYFGQIIETADSIRVQGQQVTLSFWAKAGANFSAASANLVAQVVSGTGSNDTAANAVAGSWAGQTSVVNATQALTTGWVRYQFTGTVPTGSTQLGVLFNFTPVGTAGADDSVSFSGIQLEVGGVASPFEHRDMQVEVEISQRYAWIIAEPAASVVVGMGGAVAAANAQVFYLATPVQMLKAPTVTVSAGSFKVAAGAAAAAATGMAAGTTHTPNAISINSTLTETAGGVASLQGGGGSGYIVASADF